MIKKIDISLLSNKIYVVENNSKYRQQCCSEHSKIFLLFFSNLCCTIFNMAKKLTRKTKQMSKSNKSSSKPKTSIDKKNKDDNSTVVGKTKSASKSSPNKTYLSNFTSAFFKNPHLYPEVSKSEQEQPPMPFVPCEMQKSDSETSISSSFRQIKLSKPKSYKLKNNDIASVTLPKTVATRSGALTSSTFKPLIPNNVQLILCGSTHSVPTLPIGLLYGLVEGTLKLQSLTPILANSGLLNAHYGDSLSLNICPVNEKNVIFKQSLEKRGKKGCSLS